MNIKRIKSKINEFFQRTLTVLLVAIFLWIIVSSMIFRFRHPWATDTELFLHIPNAFMLETIPYNEMRGR
jgi:hypothetical protein